jgi:TolA-binding protein
MTFDKFCGIAILAVACLALDSSLSKAGHRRGRGPMHVHGSYGGNGTSTSPYSRGYRGNGRYGYPNNGTYPNNATPHNPSTTDKTDADSAKNADAKTKSGESDSSSKSTASSTTDNADPEKKFSYLLTNARELAKSGKYEGAEQYLKRILKEAPGTTLAADAQKELSGLPKSR